MFWLLNWQNGFTQASRLLPLSQSGNVYSLAPTQMTHLCHCAESMWSNWLTSCRRRSVAQLARLPQTTQGMLQCSMLAKFIYSCYILLMWQTRRQQSATDSSGMSHGVTLLSHVAPQPRPLPGRRRRAHRSPCATHPCPLTELHSFCLWCFNAHLLHLLHLLHMLLASFVLSYVSCMLCKFTLLSEGSKELTSVSAKSLLDGTCCGAYIWS
jgi:hypothetical protein